jgi:hypothetical protein
MQIIAKFLKSTWRGFLESFLLIVACFLLIPPVQSDVSTKINFGATNWISIGLFFISRLMAFRRGGERLWTMLIQTIGFCFFVWLLYERLEIGITP